MIKKLFLKLYKRPWMDFYAQERKTLELFFVRKYGKDSLEDPKVKRHIHSAAKTCAKNTYKEKKRANNS